MTGKENSLHGFVRLQKNEYFRYYNKQKRRLSLSEYEDVPDCTDIEDVFTDKETAMKIHKLLHDLSEPYKEVFNLRVFAELSFADIAVVLGKTESWARVTYYRAKVKLLRSLEEENE